MLIAWIMLTKLHVVPAKGVVFHQIGQNNKKSISVLGKMSIVAILSSITHLVNMMVTF